MRKLPYLLALLLLSPSLVSAAASAHALTPPPPAIQASPSAGPPEEETEADEEGKGEESEADEGEDCGPEEDELCKEETEAEAEECLLEDADASIAAAPGAGEVRLRVHYRAFEPTVVVVDTRLRGSKGAFHLGTDRTRFRRAGVYRYSFNLGDKQMAKAVAAKESEIDLYAVGPPADCEMHLSTRGPRRAK